MPNRLWFWLVLQANSVLGSVLAVIFLVLDGTIALLFFIPIAILAWIFRPDDWREAFNRLL